MCSLNNAIQLYREDQKQTSFIVVKKIDNMHIPIKNGNKEIEYFNNKNEAEIERIYQQTNFDELLKVIEI